VPGPIAATRVPASARASNPAPPAARTAAARRSGWSGTPGRSARGRARAVDRDDPDRRRLDHASAPSDAARGQRRWPGPARASPRRQAGERAALEPLQPLAQRATGPNTAIAGARTPRRRPLGDRLERPDTTRWSGAFRARHRGRLVARPAAGDQPLGDRPRAARRPCTRRASPGSARAPPSRAPTRAWPDPRARSRTRPRSPPRGA
jgi:hypothetical protein